MPTPARFRKAALSGFAVEFFSLYTTRVKSWATCLKQQHLTFSSPSYSVPRKKSARMLATPSRLLFLICAILACAMGANAAAKDFTPAKPYFEQNLGQTSNPVKSLQRGPDYTLFL